MTAALPHFSMRTGSADCEQCQTNSSDKRGGRDLTFAQWESDMDPACVMCNVLLLGVQAYHGGSSCVISCDYRNREVTIQSVEPDLDEEPQKIHMFTLAGQPTCALPLVGVRAEPTQMREQNYLPILKQWLQECEASHQCKDVKGNLPTRVLDVGSSSSGYIRLYRTQMECAHYIALSHCWGIESDAQLRTTSATLQERTSGIALDALPKNYAEAVTIARALKIQYLWIDSLCIVQDDQSEWQTEATKMGSVYSNAYLVIGASCARNSHEGFLETRSDEVEGAELTLPPSHRKRKCVATIEQVDGTTSAVYVDKLDRHNHIFRAGYVGTNRPPLQTRCWTLQKQILSSRMVHFTTQEMFWECPSAVRCECLEIGVDEGGIERRASQSYRPMLEVELNDGLLRTWHLMLSSYHSRNLTYPTDFLPALSGVVAYLQMHGAGNYLAGLWQDNLVEELLWATNNNRFTYGRPEQYRAPTWSWASIEEKSRKVQRSPCLWFLGRMNTGSNSPCEVLEASCAPAGEDVNGAVTGGQLVIRGRLSTLDGQKRKTVEHPEDSQEIFRARSMHFSHAPTASPSKAQVHAMFDLSEEDYTDTVLHGLFLDAYISFADDRVYGKDNDRICFSGLILRELDDRKGVFERVGMWRRPTWIAEVEELYWRTPIGVVTIV
ncbi:hypothetical protein ACN47E_007214 [Coniothyrium glycines]